MRNQTHDLLVPRSDTLPLSQTGKLNGKPGDYKVHAKASFFPFPHMFHDLTKKIYSKKLQYWHFLVDWSQFYKGAVLQLMSKNQNWSNSSDYRLHHHKPMKSQSESK